jgi:hypothetical protein
VGLCPDCAGAPERRTSGQSDGHEHSHGHHVHSHPR